MMGGYPPKPHPRRCIVGKDEPEPIFPPTHLHACRGYGELVKIFFRSSPDPVELSGIQSVLVFALPGRVQYLDGLALKRAF